MPAHYLQPLLAPKSVALVGATEREGALGRIVWQNLAAGGLAGGLHPVNLKHREVFGQTMRPSAPSRSVAPTSATLFGARSGCR